MIGVMKLDEDWMEDVIRLENWRKTWQDDDKAKTRRRQDNKETKTRREEMNKMS